MVPSKPQGREGGLLLLLVLLLLGKLLLLLLLLLLQLRAHARKAHARLMVAEAHISHEPVQPGVCTACFASCS